MNETDDLFVGWNAAMQVLSCDDKLSIRGNLLHSIHFSVLQQLSVRNIPVLPFNYENFIKAMNKFCFRELELKKIYFSPNLYVVVDEETSVDVSIEILNIAINLAESLGLIIKGKDAVALVKTSFKQDYFITKVLVMALGELINYLKSVHSKDSKALDCLFITQVLIEWAKDKSFIQGIFNKVDYSWFPDEDAELTQSKQLLAK